MLAKALNHATEHGGGVAITASCVGADVEDHSFDSLFSTIFALFDAAVGNHEFKLVIGESYELIGILLLGVFIVFAAVLLVNLIVARMSATHEKINERALEVW